MNAETKNRQPIPENPPAGPAVLRVAEGEPGRGPDRVFSVVLGSPADDLAVVAEAAEPRSGVRIPRPGEAHPSMPGLTARPPMIFPVGFRHKGGPLISARSRFYNVRVRYARAPEA